jgi:hypothetical protein
VPLAFSAGQCASGNLNSRTRRGLDSESESESRLSESESDRDRGPGRGPWPLLPVTPLTRACQRKAAGVASVHAPGPMMRGGRGGTRILPLPLSGSGIMMSVGLPPGPGGPRAATGPLALARRPRHLTGTAVTRRTLRLTHGRGG